MRLGIFWDPSNPLAQVRPVVAALGAACETVEYTFETHGHRINPNNAFDISEQLDRDRIDTLFWIEGGPMPRDLHQCGRTTACWLINTHLEPSLWADFKHVFHWIFVAELSLAARSRCYWLPLSLTGDVASLPRGIHVFGQSPLSHAQSNYVLALHSLKSGLCLPDIPVALCLGQNGNPHPQLYNLMAAGCVCIVDAQSDVRDIGNPGEHLLVAPMAEQLGDILNAIGKDSSIAQNIAIRAREIMLHLHTPELRAKQFLDRINGCSRVLGGARFRPAISVITSCFRYLKRFRIYLESLARQLLPAGTLEIVVADPQSPDGLAEYLSEFARCNPHLRVTHVPLDARYCHNRGYCINRAFDESSGDTVISTDGDIVFPPGLVGELATISRSKPQSVLGVKRSFLKREITEAIIAMKYNPFPDFEKLATSDGDGEPDGKLGVLGYCQVLTREAFAAARYPETIDKINQSDIVFVERLGHFASVTPLFLADQTVLHLWHPRDWNGTKDFL